MSKNVVLSDKNTDYSISVIRFIAMLSIIACHVMQYYNIELAWWFNVGVQIFLCVSGFLYGQKEEINDIAFMKKNVIKILVSYYVVIIPFILIGIILDYVSLKEAILALLCHSQINGGEHLWYIPTILVCYFITPFLSRLFLHQKSKTQNIFRFITTLILTFVIFKLFTQYFNGVWISCYIFGFYLSKIKETKTYNVLSLIVFVLAIFCNCIQITIDYILNYEFNTNIINSLYNIFCHYAHLLLGVSTFLVLKILFKNAKKCKLLAFSDRYSYEIYLVHQFFILGPLSLFNKFKELYIGLPLIIILILLSATSANHISRYIKSKIIR